jgi:hypothetical protein
MPIWTSPLALLASSIGSMGMFWLALSFSGFCVLVGRIAGPICATCTTEPKYPQLALAVLGANAALSIALWVAAVGQAIAEIR